MTRCCPTCGEVLLWPEAFRAQEIAICPRCGVARQLWTVSHHGRAVAVADVRCGGWLISTADQVRDAVAGVVAMIRAGRERLPETSGEQARRLKTRIAGMRSVLSYLAKLRDGRRAAYALARAA